jgi:hypothetical protein
MKYPIAKTHILTKAAGVFHVAFNKQITFTYER